MENLIFICQFKHQIPYRHPQYNKVGMEELWQQLFTQVMFFSTLVVFF